MTMHAVLIILFFASLAAVAYAYLVYPVLICVCARLFGRRPAPPGDFDLPPLTLVVAAHNEQAVIEQRLRNALSLDYPRHKLHIRIVSDGSTDDTCSIVRRFASAGVELLELPQRCGKNAALNAALSTIDTPLVVFSDANTLMQRDALTHLARWFTDPAVGVVCGRLLVRDPDTLANAEGVYWSWETRLKVAESDLDALLGANGGIYALRRNLWVTVSDDLILDDLTIPLLSKLATGCRLVYDPQALAYEPSASGLGGEFARRARIAAGAKQALALLYPLLSLRRPWLALAFFSHKLLRWMTPFFLLALLITAALLSRVALYRAFFLAQVGLYAGAVLAAPLLHKFLRRPRGLLRLLRAGQMFPLMNLALLTGLLRSMGRRPSAIWTPTSQFAQAKAAA
jgi:cellulose synthase/poly-beta-1,6-N-acetylglucosamine synthase-like glycosyltransferase